MSKIFIGVDHGAKGALAAIDESGAIQQILPMPLKDDKIDCFQIYSWLYENYCDYEHEVIAVGERLHAIFRASAATTFSFGKNIGKVVGIIECLEMDYMEVRAVDWQKYMFKLCEVPEVSMMKGKKVKRDTKAMAAMAAGSIWGADINRYRKLDGVVDALLIAEFARRSHINELARRTHK